MKINEGNADRYIRFLLGLTFFLNIFALEPSKGGIFVLIVLSLIMFYTSFSGYCLVYDLLKFNTCGDSCKSADEKPQDAA